MQSRAIIAGNIEDEAADLLAQVEHTGGGTPEIALGLAQVKATIALGQRVAVLTEMLADRLDAARVHS